MKPDPGGVGLVSTLLMSYVSSGKSLPFPGPQFPHLHNKLMGPNGLRTPLALTFRGPSGKYVFREIKRRCKGPQGELPSRKD